MNRNHENERVGIFTVIIIVVLAVIGLYFFFSFHHPPTAPNSENQVPLEAPAPIKGI